MAGEMPYKLFFSYAAEDQKLTEHLKAAIRKAHPDSNELAMYTMQTNTLGLDYREEIKKNLNNTDIFVLIHTGRLKPAFSWVGFELGFFPIYWKRPSKSIPA